MKDKIWWAAYHALIELKVHPPLTETEKSRIADRVVKRGGTDIAFVKSIRYLYPRSKAYRDKHGK